MKLKFVFAHILINAFILSSYSQSKKEIKGNKIKCVTEYVSIIENGHEINSKNYYAVFNKNGKIIEETEYNTDGSIKKKETTKYDSNDNKIEELSFHQKENKIKKNNPEPIGTTNIKKTFSYNANNDKIEECNIDITTGKLIEKQILSYNRMGEKEKEETFDSENKLIKKTTYIYNNKGLKVEKKTYKGNDLLEETKKYVYEF